VLSVGDIFWVQPKREPWDVCEMSISGYLWSKHQGRRWIALPVFPGWVYGCHADTLVNVNSGIRGPKDLAGKHVGVCEYPVAAVAWIRDAFERAGVARGSFTWVEERSDEGSHYRPFGYQVPAPTEQVPMDKTLCEMLIDGQVDACTRYFGGPGRSAGQSMAPLSDRSEMTMTELAAHPNVRWLYEDRKAEAIDYSNAVGGPQPIHCLIVKEEVLDKNPWVAKSLYDAFAEAMRVTQAGSKIQTSFDFPEQDHVISRDFSPFGLDARNRRMMERYLDLMEKDDFFVGSRKPSVDEIFDESTLS
jgi:4,5-dihydroxyphthalate decarboxylase